MTRPSGPVAVIGGGRWARVIVRVLAELLPRDSELAVYSRANAHGMETWVRTLGIRRPIQVSADWPGAAKPPFAAIIANAAGDHFAAARHLLSAGIPVLVEKPLALDPAQAAELVRVADERGVPLASSQVFLFARYLTAFAAQLGSVGALEALEIEWTDPAGEVRHGESKRYDPDLPLAADTLPHIVPIIEKVTSRLPLRVLRRVPDPAGKRLELELDVPGIACRVSLAREAPARLRRIIAAAGGARSVLDFSVEPGTIATHAGVANADPGWSTGPRPLASMLKAFLDWAGGGAQDPRLATGAALAACRLALEAAD
jgi:hypothetical protein